MKSMPRRTLIRNRLLAASERCCRSASPEFGGTGTTESTRFGDSRNPWNLEPGTWNLDQDKAACEAEAEAVSLSDSFTIGRRQASPKTGNPLLQKGNKNLAQLLRRLIKEVPHQRKCNE
ncbi:hypothetical protein [Haliea sp.]